MKQGDYVCVSIPFLKKRLFGRTVPVPNFTGYLIRLGTWSRYDHCFIYIGNNQIVEAQPGGATVSNLNKYSGYKMIWSSDKLTKDQRTSIALKALLLRGTPYGFLDIVYLGLATLGLRLDFILRRVERQDRLICSQLVALCGEAGKESQWLCGKPNACLVTPADLAIRIYSGALS